MKVKLNSAKNSMNVLDTDSSSNFHTFEIFANDTLSHLAQHKAPIKMLTIQIKAL